MNIYINGISAISPQNTFENSSFLEEIENHERLFLEIITPNYKAFINPKQLRRMSKIIRMGVASGNMALQNAKVENPDAIITGTGLGCIVDTEKFLNSLLENKEQLLTPTSFILSTHNTISAQIAVMLTCNNYNYTYVHSSVSFENALLDAHMHFSEGKMKNILVGGIDEITEENYNTKINSQIWKTEAPTIKQLYQTNSAGCIPGESSSFAVLSTEKTESSLAQFKDVHTVFQASEQELTEELDAFLEKNQLKRDDIDLLVLGMNGDARYDQSYMEFAQNNCPNASIASFKNICGEHDSASAFAFWVAAKIAKEQNIPEIILQKTGTKKDYQNILIYHYNFMHCNNHAFTLITK
jgi:3-oxoacyl-(acyl-carrier-protein) synthase